MKTVGIFITVSLFLALGSDDNQDRDVIPQDSARSAFDSILNTYVDSTGRVDYSVLSSNPSRLELFLEFVAEVSPESRPDLFQSDNERKAYWINVYNALVIKAVVDHPGVSSIGDIAWGKGIFWRRRFQVGGRKMTLNHIEHRILRRKFRDPRIHFAINCASNSCPPLGNRIFEGRNLDSLLEEKTASFIRDENNVLIDHEREEIRLSRIFKWYRNDFARDRRGLLEYIIRYLPRLSEGDRERVVESYRVRFNEYDWGLNRQPDD